MADILRRAQDFLNARNRFGTISTLRKDGSPFTVPLWYDWDGTTISFFSSIAAAKLKRLANDSRITLTVASESDEVVMQWVSFEGRATISREGAKDLALALTQRYVGDAPSEPSHKAMKASFEAMSEQYICKVSFVPERGFAMLGDDRVVPLF